MPPVKSRCAHLPENLLGYDAGSGCGAPLAPPSSVMVGTVIPDPSQAVFKIVVLRLSLNQPQPPAIVMDHHADMVRVVECFRRSLERRVVETPLRGCDLPNRGGPRAAPVRREVVLVPPFELRLRRQRHFVGFSAADQVSADRHERVAALGPQRRDDIRGPGAPIEGDEDRSFDAESAAEGSPLMPGNRCLRTSSRALVWYEDLMQIRGLLRVGGPRG